MHWGQGAPWTVWPLSLGIYTGLNGDPKRYVYTLTPGSFECDLIWKKRLFQMSAS